MRLADFIRTELESILQKWEVFAKTIIPPGKVMSSVELRDHAEQMLRAIADDLDIPQTPEEQFAKSIGKGPENEEETAAEVHASTRLLSGFTINEMVSEYRALRASVLTLWIAKVKAGVDFETEDMTRFNEAIDQALAESIARYSQTVTESQHIFLGILGHDLRTPLGAISLGSQVLLQTEDLDSRSTKIASRIYASVDRANNIVENLLDFTRSHLGKGIPIILKETNLTAACQNIIDEGRAYNPECIIKFESPKELIGQFDGNRLEQVFSNLIQNAIQHGDHTETVMVNLHADQDEITFAVHNKGMPISESDLSHIFEPMTRYSKYAFNDFKPRSGLGLGLYIAHEIVVAHQGRIEVESTLELGTTFSIKLPFTRA